MRWLPLVVLLLCSCATARVVTRVAPRSDGSLLVEECDVDVDAFVVVLAAQRKNCVSRVVEPVDP